MIPLKRMRVLDCHVPTQDGRPSFVAAGSGLVLHEGTFYVVADDELSLAVFEKEGKGKGEFISLLPGELPLEHAARKKTKPDFEALTYIPKNKLLALPSGSKENRSLAILYDLKSRQKDLLDLSSFYSLLQTFVQDLNLEGGLVKKDLLYLFQRGNGKKKENGIFKLSLHDFLQGHYQSINFKKYDLGELKGVSLSFTDAALAADGRIFYLAAAESGESTYDDGTYTGAVLGILDSSDEITFQEEINCPGKPEGLSFDDDGNFYVITDEDSDEKVAILYQGQI